VKVPSIVRATAKEKGAAEIVLIHHLQDVADLTKGAAKLVPLIHHLQDEVAKGAAEIVPLIHHLQDVADLTKGAAELVLLIHPKEPVDPVKEEGAKLEVDLAEAAVMKVQ
jgi:uncharacterized protein Yka (UPF0111/DUF47 family)